MLRIHIRLIRTLFFCTANEAELASERWSDVRPRARVMSDGVTGGMAIERSSARTVKNPKHRSRQNASPETGGVSLLQAKGRDRKTGLAGHEWKEERSRRFRWGGKRWLHDDGHQWICGCTFRGSSEEKAHTNVHSWTADATTQSELTNFLSSCDPVICKNCNCNCRYLLHTPGPVL